MTKNIDFSLYFLIMLKIATACMLQVPCLKILVV